MQRILCILPNLPYSSAFFSGFIPILAHPISDPCCPLFPDKVGPFSLCLPAEFWSCFLAHPFPRWSFCHCIVFSCRGLLHPSPSVLFQICIFLLFFNWFCLIIFLTANVFLLDIGLSFVPAPKQMFVHWDVLEDAWKNDHVAILETSDLVSDLETTSICPRARWNSKLNFICLVKAGQRGKKYAVFLFLMLKKFWFSFCSIAFEQTVHWTLQHSVILIYLKHCVVLSCLCALASNYFSLCSPGVIL